MMSSNSFGRIFRFTSFGESHGKAIGGIIDGMPAGFSIDFDFIQRELDKRRPGINKYTSSRKEKDRVKFLSGIFEGKTLGTPIAFIIENKDVRSEDYLHLKDVFRPGHADLTYHLKYGHRDWRGGGRQSARETAARVVAGALAKLLLKKIGVEIFAYVSQIGKIKVVQDYQKVDLSKIYASPVRCPVESIAEKMIKNIEEAKQQGDSLGGKITCVIKNVPPGLGEPVFDKFHSRLAAAIMSINACRAFEIGNGINAAALKGSEFNDQMTSDGKKVNFLSNNAGGIIGGITTGQDIYLNAYFKPTPTIAIEQQTITTDLQNTKIDAKGRHDPCVVIRAVPVVEAMTAITFVDFYMLNNKKN